MEASYEGAGTKSMRDFSYNYFSGKWGQSLKVIPALKSLTK